MIKVSTTSYYPITGYDSGVYRYAIKYSIGEFEKSFTTESNKPKLTHDEVYEIIVDHEKKDNIEHCVCGEIHDGQTSKTTKSEEKEVQASDSIEKLLNDPRVKSISINIDKVGAIEQTRITANLKDNNKEVENLNSVIDSLKLTIEILCNTIMNKPQTDNEAYTIIKKRQPASICKPINNCPMCGRKLN